MATERRHMAIDVAGALMNFKPREWRNNVRDENGRYLTPEEVKRGLIKELANGHRLIPMGGPCEGFDYSGGGCPGHPVPDEPNPR